MWQTQMRLRSEALERVMDNISNSLWIINATYKILLKAKIMVLLLWWQQCQFIKPVLLGQGLIKYFT